MQSEIPGRAVTAADLSACENEPIQIPGAIQPHGMLLAVDVQTRRVVTISANVSTILGRDASTVLNARIDELLGDGAFDRLKRLAVGTAIPSLMFVERFTLAQSSTQYDVLVHAVDDLLIVEFDLTQPATSRELETLLVSVRQATLLIQSTSSLPDVMNIVVEQIGKLTGYERVMLYKFDEQWNGEVVAEYKLPELEPFLGLHYPASDIPRQARELYRRNTLRAIPDARYQPVALIPPLNPLTGSALDLSLSSLRSVSPVHLEYLANMGVRATLTISLLKHGKLWGMISAHDREARYTPFRERVACEIIGRTGALQITSLEDAAEAESRMHLRSFQPILVESIDRSGEITQAMAIEALMQITNASGAAIKTDGEVQLIGATPARRDVRRLLAWLEERDHSDGDQPFATDCLPIENPDFAEFKDTACGLLAVPLTTTRGGWLIWFRPEYVHTVNWGGEPSKMSDGAGGRVSPRKSFESWQEQVRLHARPWKPVEIESAVELRRIVSDVMMRRAREYAEMNARLARSNEELESFAYVASHDLKEPLRGIHHYAQFLDTDYGESLDERGREMLHGIGTLARRMESQIQSLLSLAEVGHDETEASVSCDANAALDEALELLRLRLEAANATVERVALPNVRIAHARLREIFVNLIGNALKYNDKGAPRIKVGAEERKRPNARPLPRTADPEADRMLTFFVQDNGIGIREKHFSTIFRMFKRLHAREAYGGGTGAGLAIARKIVEQQGGSMWVESTLGEGSTFFFTMPLA